jgi:hypothetical protein
MAIASNFIKTYTTHSGIDIKALFDDMQVMTMQGIAVSVTREKVPIYALGSPRPLSISRGKRGIAGTLQFVLFDREALYSLMQDPDHWYYAHADDINWLNNTYNPASFQADIGAQNQRTIGGQDFAVVRSVRSPAEYMDQIYPFDVTLNAFNEYGNGSFSAIIGLEIINEGTGLSIDDLTNEVQCTYIALHRLPWTPLDSVDAQGNYWATNVSLNDVGQIYTYGGQGSTGQETPVVVTSGYGGATIGPVNPGGTLPFTP